MKSRLPPGPSLLSFMLRYPADPAAFYRACQREYGPIFTTSTTFGRVVVTGDPAAARAIYSAPPDATEAFEPDMLAPFLGDKSVIVMSGCEHARARKLVMPPFHGERMRAYAAIMAATARRIVSDQPVGKPFAMLPVTQRIALDVMLEAVLGLSVEREPELAAELTRAIFAHVEAMVPSIVFLPALRRNFAGLGPWARFTRARAHLDEVVYRIIGRRRATADGRVDVLRMLMDARDEEGHGLTDQELRDELLTLLFAGHETTAIATAWAFYHLLRNREEMVALLAELGPVKDSWGVDGSIRSESLAELPRLGAVCNESLRVFPVVVDVPRTLRRPMELLGYEIPAGVTVSASPLLLHAHEDTFPNPCAFRPARFLGRKPFAPHEFAPFGGGSRRCIGAAFALYEMKIVIGTILRERTLRLASDRPERSVRRGFVMAPERGVELVIDA